MAQITMYPAFTNSIETTTTNSISDTDTIIYVLADIAIPSAPNLLVLGTGASAETVLMTDKTGNMLTVTRGVQGSAKPWPNSTIIARNYTAYDHDTFKANIEDNAAQLAQITPYKTSHTIHVATTGNDTTGDGSQLNPFRTITNALSNLRKNIEVAEVKIRVLAGDYSNEGVISIIGFKGTSLTITAFNGTSDILTPSDNYIIHSFSCYDSDILFINGFKTSTTTTYGIFCSACKFVAISGYKNVTLGTSGVGATGGSVVYIKDSTAQNLNTVISSNQGAVAISQNWISSSGNTTGIRVNTGAKVHMYDNSQPVATNPYTQSNGGVIFDAKGNLVSKDSVQQIFFQRDVSLDGNFDIAISLSQKPSWIKASACIVGTQMASEGHWANNAEFCIATKADGSKTGFYNIMRFENGANLVEFDVVSVASDKITFSKTASGALTGTLYLTLLCGI